MKSLLVFLCVCVASIGCEDKGLGRTKTQAKETKELEGTWVAVAVIDHGVPERNPTKLKLIIEGDDFTYDVSGNAFSAKYSIDPNKDPKEMDVFIKEGPAKGKTMLAIYTVEGDKLKICGGDDRPVGFVSSTQSKTILFEYRRNKP